MLEKAEFSNTLYGKLTAKESSRFLHPFRNRNAERTAGFAGAAADACGSFLFQKFIVRLYGRRYVRLHRCEIIELINHSNIQINDTGLAVAAVGAFAAVGMKRRVCKD